MNFKRTFIVQKVKRFYIFMWGLISYFKLNSYPNAIKDNSNKHILICAVINFSWFYEVLFITMLLKHFNYKIDLIVNKKLLRKKYFYILYLLALRRNVTVKYVGNSDNKSKDIVSNYAITNLIYWNKLESVNEINESHSDQLNRFSSDYTFWADYIGVLLTKSNYDRVIVPSGIISESAAIYNTCRKLKTKVITLETFSFKTTKRIVSVNNIAINDTSYFKNIDKLGINQNISNYIADYLKYQNNPIINQEIITGFLGYQKSSVKSSNKTLSTDNGLKHILIFTNTIGDSATLEKQSPFTSQLNWIETVLLFLKESPNKIIIRIHPIEKQLPKNARLGDRIKIFIQYHKIENTILLEAENETNSFSLIENSLLALVWTSSIGADLVIRNVPTISAAESSYKSLNFTFYGKSITDYFSLLEKGLDQKLKLDQFQIDRAKKYVYYSFKTRLLTIFEFPLYKSFYLLNRNIILSNKYKIGRYLVALLS